MNNLHEKNIYKDPSFPIEIFKITKNLCIPPGRGFKDMHWHEDLQFTIVKSGSIVITINGSNYTLNSKEAIYINSSSLHATTFLSDDAEYISINFPSKLLKYFPGSKIEQLYVIPYTTNLHYPPIKLTPAIDWQNKCLNHINLIIDLANSQKDYGWEYKIAINIFNLWFEMISNTQNLSKTYSDTFLKNQTRMQLMLSYIYSNYNKPISLIDISNSAHISNSECLRCFNKMIGTTPIEYLIKYRINKSIDLLTTTNLSIYDISNLIGFKNVNHFIQSFKKRENITPAKYRKFKFTNFNTINSI